MTADNAYIHALPRILESDIRRLLWIFNAGQLQDFLRAIGDQQTHLKGFPPSVIACRFCESVQMLLRSSNLTVTEFRNTALKFEELLRRNLQPDSIIPHLHSQFERAFFVFGLRRGGNHAIAEWLKGHFAENEILHLNNAEISFYEQSNDSLRIDRARYYGLPMMNTESVLLVGYENIDFLEFPWEHNQRIAKRSDIVVILRDYPNMAASIARNARDRPTTVFNGRLRDFPIKWREYALNFRQQTGGYTYVLFNQWFVDIEYRRNLSIKLGLSFSDRGLNVVSSHGKGSSFDGIDMNGAGQTMDVLTRTDEMKDDDLYRFLLHAVDGNLSLNQELFGNSPID